MITSAISCLARLWWFLSDSYTSCSSVKVLTPIRVFILRLAWRSYRCKLRTAGVKGQTVHCACPVSRDLWDGGSEITVYLESRPLLVADCSLCVTRAVKATKRQGASNNQAYVMVRVIWLRKKPTCLLTVFFFRVFDHKVVIKPLNYLLTYTVQNFKYVPRWAVVRLDEYSVI